MICPDFCPIVLFYGQYQKYLWRKLMELYQLKTFVVIADEENLTRASERLFLTQPAISSHIKMLEEELGIELFTRNPKGMILTNAGKRLKTEADLIINSMEKFKNTAISLKNEISGKITVGVNSGIDILNLSEIFALVTKKYPLLELSLIQSNSHEILQNIKKGNFEIGFIFGENNFAEIEKLALTNIELCIVGPSKWKEKTKNLPFSGLVKYPWILTPPACPFSSILNKLFDENNMHPDKYIIVDQEVIINYLVKSESGFSLMLKPDAEAAQKNGDAFIWKHKNIDIELSTVYLKNKKNFPLINAVLECIKEIWEIG
jgi:DNA-binding transcriptional LysR family regulator